jgi:predicted dehydrogenase
VPEPRVALIGANGHGRWHRRELAARHDAGRLRLVGLCDVNPIEAADDAPVPADVPLFTDHREMLAAARPDVVVICTPPHTHLTLAGDAARAGCDLLLEKPPVLSLSEHHELEGLLAATGRLCQVGFQALGSAALARLAEAIGAGRLGPVDGVSAVASWQRSDAYYARSPWAGRRQLDGRPVLDGALANPLAHAVMQCLALAGMASLGAGAITVVELERYRTRPIEVDDTACLRVRLASGVTVVVAVTLCGEDFIAGEVAVHGRAGRAVLEYPTDRLALPGDPGFREPTYERGTSEAEAKPHFREVPGRISLLDNLLEHRERPDEVPLIAPLARTAPFTALIEVIAHAPPPTPIAAGFVGETGAAPERHTVVRGVNAAVRRAADELSLFSELGVEWATAPYVVRLDDGDQTRVSLQTKGIGTD